MLFSLLLVSNQLLYNSCEISTNAKEDAIDMQEGMTAVHQISSHATGNMVTFGYSTESDILNLYI